MISIFMGRKWKASHALKYIEGIFIILNDPSLLMFDKTYVSHICIGLSDNLPLADSVLPGDPLALNDATKPEDEVNHEVNHDIKPEDELIMKCLILNRKMRLSRIKPEDEVIPILNRKMKLITKVNRKMK
jgi:hypothetical protein